MSWTVFPRIYTNLKPSPTARNFSNSRPIYVILWEMRNHYRNIWFIKNSKCQHFLFLKKQPQNGQIFQLFVLHSKGRHFNTTKLGILIFSHIPHLEIDFWNLSWKRIVFAHLYSVVKNTINEQKEWNSTFNSPKEHICEFSIRMIHNYIFQNYQQNWGFNISCIWQNLTSKMLFCAN